MDNLVNALGQLVDTLTSIVGVHVLVFCAEVTPLEAVDGSQISHVPIRQSSLVQKLSRAIAIPNMNVLGRQIIGIGVALNRSEPGL